MPSQYCSKTSIFLMLSFISFVRLSGQNPGWTAPNPAVFEYNASAICAIEFNDITSNNLNDRIAFFVGNSLRGLSKPVNVGSGQILHFVTIYSNTPVMDMEVKMFHNNSGLVYQTNKIFKFKTQDIVGSLISPYLISVYTDGDSPIGIEPLPSMSTFQNVAFDPLDLEEFLVQPDTNAVMWSYDPNPNVIVTINGSILEVEPVSTFFGTTTLIVRVTEVSPNQNFADATITLHVDEAPIPPNLSGIPNQAILLGGQFTDFNLNNYEEQYSGSCLDLDYVPVIEETIPNESFPDWNFVGQPLANMTFTIQSNFTPKHTFDNSGDRMAFFTNNELRAVSFPITYEGKTLYFVTMGGDDVETDSIEIRFYSAAMKKVFSTMTNFSFTPHGIVGDADAPYVIDFSPLIPTIGTDGNVHVMIADTNWIGEQKFNFTAKDCDYPQYVFDQTTVSFCVLDNLDNAQTFYFDADGDGYGSPAKPNTACSATEGWVENNLDCNDNDPNIVSLEVVMAFDEDSVIPDDGHICSGSNALITASGGESYLWSNGLTTASLAVSTDTTIQYLLTVTSLEGCTKDTFATLIVESNVVTDTINAGPGTLRSVLECVVEGGIIYFDQPITNHNAITAPLDVYKNVTIIGLSPNIRPYIGIDFTANDPSISVMSGKTLNLKDVDLHLINQTDNKPVFTGNGYVVVSGITNITE